jgi:hypothetical protein
MGIVLCHAGIGLFRDSPEALRVSIASAAALRQAPDAPLDMVVSMLLVEAQSATRLARLTADPQEEHRAAKLLELARGMTTTA